MKKLKLLVCSICILLASFVFVACGDKDDDLDKIDASEIEITDEFEYNGNPHILVAKYDDEVISGISYSLDNLTYKKANEFLEIVGSPDQDVEYLVYFKIELEGYETYSGKFEVEVELPEIEIGVSYSNLTQTYDGSKKMFTIKYNNNIVTDVKYSLTQNGTYVSDLNLYNADTYKVYFKFKLDGYAEYRSYKMFTIEKKELTADMFSLVDADGLVYTGEEHEVCVNIENSIVDIDDVDVSYENNVNAGTATVIISSNNGSNFTGSVTKTFEIAKKEVTVTANDVSVIKGTEVADLGLTATEVGLVAGDTLNYTLSAKNYTETANIAENFEIDMEEGENLNYNITFTKGTLTVVDAVEVGGRYFADLASTLSVVEDDDEIILHADIEILSTLFLNKNMTINGQGKYKLIASESFTADNMIEISTDVEVILEDIEVNANSKARVIKVSAGTLYVYGAKITGGMSKSFVGGVFVTNAGQFYMNGGEITGNDYVNSATDTVYYKAYSKDLWIGANAAGMATDSNVYINGGKIGYVFVNANEYSANNPGIFVMDAGEIDTIYVEYDAGFGATFTYAGGAVEHLLISTTESGVANEVEIKGPLMFIGGTNYSNN